MELACPGGGGGGGEGGGGQSGTGKTKRKGCMLVGEKWRKGTGTVSSSSAILCGILDDMKLEQTTLYSVAQTLYTRSLFLSSRAYRDPTVPITQYNGLCHVTLYHTYPLGVDHQASRTFSGDKKLGTPIAHQPTTVVEHAYHRLHK